MVSLNPNPQLQEFYVDPTKMGLPGLDSFPTPTKNTTAVTTSTNAAALSSEDPNKKVRKPYTITKSRESWTEQEHDKFLEALQLFDRDWKKIEAFVGSKTVIQIRSHAQKYFLKVQKNGTSEHVPPPRPKRKAAHPYPQKASKNAPVVSQVTGPFPSSAALLGPGYGLRPDSLSIPSNSASSASLTSWTYNTVPPASMPHVATDDVSLTVPTVAHNCSYSSSNESTPRIWPVGDANDQRLGKHGKPTRVMPDFAQVYSFIGSVFDPNASGHLQKLKRMDPINVETIKKRARQQASLMTAF
ncbi:hypothetical protein F0562_015049 [Nyssa sinensis]|uniref:Uncharacterized protein n=1 Tax=Nyssa sinensis TaxID=561372 RepID=A0A5J4ZRL9_9ASTE|nr:hypothetical protein F0562_015049 [Nyssa sinensis]